MYFSFKFLSFKKEDNVRNHHFFPLVLTTCEPVFKEILCYCIQTHESLIDRVLLSGELLSSGTKITIKFILIFVYVIHLMK